MIFNIVIALCIFSFGIPLAIALIGGLVALVAHVIDGALKGLNRALKEVLHYRPSKVSATAFLVVWLLTGTFVLVSMVGSREMNLKAFSYSYACGAAFGLATMLLTDEIRKMRKTSCMQILSEGGAWHRPLPKAKTTFVARGVAQTATCSFSARTEKEIETDLGIVGARADVLMVKRKLEPIHVYGAGRPVCPHCNRTAEVSFARIGRTLVQNAAVFGLIR